MQHTGHTAYMQDLSDFASTHRSTRCNQQPLEPLKHLHFDLMPHRTSCFSLFVSVCCVWIQFWGLSDCLFDTSMICTHSQSFIYYFSINSHLPREKKTMLEPTPWDVRIRLCTPSFLRTLTVPSLASNMFGRSVSGVLGSSGLSRTECEYRTVVCSLHPRSSERSTLWHPVASASQPFIRFCHLHQRTGFIGFLWSSHGMPNLAAWPCRFRDPRALWHSSPPSPPDRSTQDLADTIWYWNLWNLWNLSKRLQIRNHSKFKTIQSFLSWCSLAIRQHNCASLRTVQLTPLDSSSMLPSPSGIAWLERWNVGFGHSV